MEVKPPFFGRGINLFPFGGRQEYIFPTEAPDYDLVFPVSLEYRSFVVFQELPELRFVSEGDPVTMIKVAFLLFCPLVQVKLPVGLGREVSIHGIGFGIEP